MVNDARTELFYNGVWNDISTDVRQDPPVMITWGRASEAAAVSPSSMSLTLNSPDGKFSPRNPRSPLYGKIGRNTPIRERLGAKSAALELTGADGGVDGSYASTPDAAALDITGDIDIRMEVEPDTWRPADDVVLAAKAVSGSLSWYFQFTTTGALRWRWSTAGSSFLSWVTSPDVVSSSAGRLAVRVTMDVDNGAAQREIKFWTASSITGTWTQLGSTVVTSGTTSIFAGTSALTVGAMDGGRHVPVRRSHVRRPGVQGRGSQRHRRHRGGQP